MQVIERVPPLEEGAADGESAATAGWFSRLKAAIGGSLAALRNACANLLGRLRGKPAKEEEPAADAPKAERRREDAPAEEGEAAPAGPRRWRALLAYAAAILLGALAAGGGTYYFVSATVARQSAELGRQQEKIAQQQALLAGYEKILVLEQKKMDDELARLSGQEKTLALDHRKLEEILAKLNDQEKGLVLDYRKLKDEQAKLVEERKNQLAQLQPGRGKDAARPDPASGAGSKPQTAAARTGNCELRGANISAALKGCIDEFNRQ